MKIHTLLLPALVLCGCSENKDTHAADKSKAPSYEHTDSKAPAQAPSASVQEETDTDRQLVENVRRALSDDAATATVSKDIQLSSLSGTVTLRGTVASADDMSAIEKLVRAVPGVRAVNDELQVKSQ
jgi:osmotically-inducible protein OsmY